VYARFSENAFLDPRWARRYKHFMFGLSGEHLLILAVVLVIFGPRKLPELGASIGKAVKNFKEGLSGPTTSGQLESKAPQAHERVQFTPAARPVEEPIVNVDSKTHSGPSASV
jgi:sec-independent protein translocase protein TatA